MVKTTSCVIFTIYCKKIVNKHKVKSNCYLTGSVFWNQSDPRDLLDFCTYFLFPFSVITGLHFALFSKLTIGNGEKNYVQNFLKWKQGNIFVIKIENRKWKPIMPLILLSKLFCSLWQIRNPNSRMHFRKDIFIL